MPVVRKAYEKPGQVIITDDEGTGYMFEPLEIADGWIGICALSGAKFVKKMDRWYFWEELEDEVKKFNPGFG